MIVVTERTLVGKVDGKQIYRIKSIKILPVGPMNEKNQGGIKVKKINQPFKKQIMLIKKKQTEIDRFALQITFIWRFLLLFYLRFDQLPRKTKEKLRN